jgi:hypothetical protein
MQQIVHFSAKTYVERPRCSKKFCKKIKNFVCTASAKLRSLRNGTGFFGEILSIMQILLNAVQILLVSKILNFEIKK